jgi:hypothetical protein
VTPESAELAGVPALTRLLLGAMVVGLLIGCTVRPPDAVELAFYMRNLSGETHSFRFFGDHPGDAPSVGYVDEGPASTGCGHYASDWELGVTDDDGPPGPGDDFVAHVTAEDTGNRDPAAIALTIQEDGSAFIEFGVPEWWGGEIQRCP